MVFAGVSYLCGPHSQFSFMLVPKAPVTPLPPLLHDTILTFIEKTEFSVTKMNQIVSIVVNQRIQIEHVRRMCRTGGLGKDKCISSLLVLVNICIQLLDSPSNDFRRQGRILCSCRMISLPCSFPSRSPHSLLMVNGLITIVHLPLAHMSYTLYVYYFCF